MIFSAKVFHLNIIFQKYKYYAALSIVCLIFILVSFFPYKAAWGQNYNLNGDWMVNTQDSSGDTSFPVRIIHTDNEVIAHPLQAGTCGSQIWNQVFVVTLNGRTLEGSQIVCEMPGAFLASYPLQLLVNDKGNEMHGSFIDPAVGSVFLETVTMDPNGPPIANAGSDETAYEGTTVTLDGSRSLDPLNSPLNFTWTQVDNSGHQMNLIDSDPIHPYFNAPIVNKETVLTFHLVVSNDILSSDPDTVSITIKPQFTINVNENPAILNPYHEINSYPRGSNPQPPQSQITVSVTHAINNDPAENIDIIIESCTRRGNDATDGHIHDTRIIVPCIQGDRPEALFTDGSGRSSNPISITTDNGGVINLQYRSPMIETDRGRFFISGTDTITAKSVAYPSMSGTTEVTTKVTDSLGADLELMPGANNCAGVASYIFIRQDNHGCLFFGTVDTNFALEDIANQYLQRQIDCRMNPGGQPCIIILPDGTPATIAINADPIPMRITAMSLPWGGLSDIFGNWRHPHETHNDGKNIDIGFGGLPADDDRILLLRYLITQNINFGDFPNRTEGRDMTQTRDHFHILFQN